MTSGKTPVRKSDIEVIEVSNSKIGLKEFIDLPFQIYKSDSNFCPRLKRDQWFQFSPANPFYKHSKVSLYIAKSGQDTLGRIASVVNYNHLNFHKDKSGFFGFFEAYDNVNIAEALFRKVEDDLRQEGLNTIIGPMNFSTNEECGLLVEGFSEPPMIMMPYNPPYYESLISSQGLLKAKDLFAYQYILQDTLPDKVYRVASIAEKRGALVRTLSKKTLYEDMRAFQYVYNRAWASNWCFVPISDEELDYTVKELKMIINEELVAIAYSGDQPVGFLGVIPDVNMILKVMKGVINPLTLIKAIINLKRINQGRLLLFGIVPEFRNKGVEALLFREVHKGLLKTSIRRIEFSWVLEDNIPTIKIAELFGGLLYKRYRIFQKTI